MCTNPVFTNPMFTPQATRLSANGIAEKVRHLQEDLQELIKDENIQDAAGGGNRSPRMINSTGQRTRAGANLKLHRVATRIAEVPSIRRLQQIPETGKEGQEAKLMKMIMVWPTF